MSNIKSIIISIIFVACTVLIGATPAYAAYYDVGKLIYQVTPKNPIDTAVITNNRNTPLYVQIKLMKRQRKDGKDILTPTKDIAAYPPIVKLGPKQSQTVRIVMHGPFTDNEQLYRMIINDITPLPQYAKIKPKGAPKGTSVALNFRFKYVLSVYAAPIKYHMVAGIKAKYKQHKLYISLKNNGNATLRVNQIAFSHLVSNKEIATSKKGATVFRGEQHNWVLPTTGKIPAKIRAIVYLANAPKLLYSISVTK
ncbi:MAG: fimbria/pilus periplasmic chaperone [Gammaproteobacteria bacterium]|nr:fimbria/pilus periplasmic chaperone [Gammaproteobacteria bacterium]